MTTTTHMHAIWVLAALEYTVTWARMKCKPKKSRCLVLKKGRISQQFKMNVQGDDIPTIVNNPIKCLGKWFDASLTDKNQTKELNPTVISWLKKVNERPTREIQSLDLPAWNPTKIDVVAADI